MEAGPPQSEPPPPPSEPKANGEKLDGRWRAIGVVLALALGFACAVMVAVMIDIGGTPRCDDPAAIAEEREATDALVVECFDGSQLQKTLSLALGWPGGIVAGIAALVALLFTVSGRHGPLMLRLTGAAIVLGGLSILIGSI